MFGYPSVFGGPDVAVPSLIGRLRAQGPVSLVGHSLGATLSIAAAIVIGPADLDIADVYAVIA